MAGCSGEKPAVNEDLNHRNQFYPKTNKTEPCEVKSDKTEPYEVKSDKTERMKQNQTK